MGRKSLCDKEVSEIKYHTDLFILEQGEARRGLQKLFGEFSAWRCSTETFQGQRNERKVQAKTVHIFVYLLLSIRRANSLSAERGDKEEDGGGGQLIFFFLCYFHLLIFQQM